VAQVVNLGSHVLIIGEIMETHVSRNCLTDGQPDVAKIRPFAYSEGLAAQYYALGELLAPAFKAGRKLKA
jgi:flavin reductase (DIM6/NTAB) family NADH-FMN oxidoreductase RutF